jgi:hypothetical protein
VELHNGSFENVLHVSRISMNMLSVYHITQKGKKVEFTPDSTSVLDMHEIPLLQLVRWITSQGFINSLSFLMMTPIFYLHKRRVLCIHLHNMQILLCFHQFQTTEMIPYTQIMYMEISR